MEGSHSDRDFHSCTNIFCKPFHIISSTFSMDSEKLPLLYTQSKKTEHISASHNTKFNGIPSLMHIQDWWCGNNSPATTGTDVKKCNCSLNKTPLICFPLDRSVMLLFSLGIMKSLSKTQVFCKQGKCIAKIMQRKPHFQIIHKFHNSSTVQILITVVGQSILFW